MSLFYDDEYEMANGNDLSALLNDIPYDLTKVTIMKQIENPTETKVNYLETFNERCDYLLDEYSGDGEAINEIKNLKNSMYIDMLKAMDDKFDFDFDLESFSSSELEEGCDSIYRLLILGYTRVISKYIYKVIKDNRKSFSEQYADQISKKDVSTVSMKKKTKDKEAIIIISCLPNIINDVLELSCEAEDFIRTVTSEDSYEGDVILNLIQTNKITGNFTEAYINYVVTANESIMEEIYVSVRSKLISKLNLNKGEE